MTGRSVRHCGLALLLGLSTLAPLSAQAVVVVTDEHFNTMVADVKATMLADPEVAIKKAARALSYADHVTDPKQRELMRTTAVWLQGDAYTRTGENKRGAPLIDQAVKQAESIAPGSRLHADTLLSRGSIRLSTGDVAGAMNDFHQAYSLFLVLADPRSCARALAEIANLYYHANDWASALKYYGQALEAFGADPGLAVAVLNGRGLTFMELKKLDAASKEFEQALTIARGMNSPLLTATVINNAARVWLARGDLAAADRAISESVSLTRSIAPAEFASSQSALAAQSAYQRGNYPRAAILIAQTFAGADLTKTTLADREAHKTAYDTYRALKRDDLALAHLTALKRLDDEATELARSNGAALMAARFDFANQEVRIANLKADDLQKSVAFERARARTQRIALLSGVGVTLLIIAMLTFGVVSLRRSRNKVRAANADLAETNSALGKALAAKTEFLATTSHEIRTPLNGILGMTQVMLADGRLDAATRDRVGVVHSAGVTMRALVDDILDVAKMETGNLTIETVAFDLSRVITNATKMWQDQATAKGLTFAVDLDGAPGRIVGDPARLRQIVFNLLSNALKFTAEGSVTLAVETVGARYRIAVGDSGIGIAPGKEEEIFESFKQADSGTTRQFGGTGLGLSICRNLARAMGGDVTVRSVPGQGSTFLIELPLVAAEAEEYVAADAATVPGTLIVDRNPITRAMFKALLEQRNGSVVTAASLDEAINIARKSSFSRVLIDDATAREASDLHAELSMLSQACGNAVLALLWRRDDAREHAALRACGVDIVLMRPISREALVAAICDEPTAECSRTLVTHAA